MSQQELPQRVSGARPPQDAPVPTHLQCSSCSQPLFNGFQTPHGCRLCQPCVTGLLPPVEKRPCPGSTEACRDTTEEIELSQASCFPDMATRREVARLKVLCPNRGAGCSVALRWSLMDQHLDSCDFQALPCELCAQQVARRDMQRHSNRECLQRKERCGKCTKMVIFSEMESRHRNLESDVCCPMFSATCPHCRNSKRKLDRRAYVAHLSECPERPVECKYSHLGCAVTVRRSELDKHYREGSDSHIYLLDQKLRQIGSSPSTRQPQTAPSSSSPSEVTDLKRRVDCIDLSFKKMQVNVADWMQSMLDFVQLADRFGGISRMRESLQSCSERFSQLESRVGASRPHIDALQVSRAVVLPQKPQLQQLVGKLETRLLNLENTSYDGTFSWRVRNLSIESRSQKPLESIPFFLRRFGPAFMIQLYLSGAGAGSGTHLSVYLVNVSHHLDDPSDWPIVAEATFRLINLKDRRQDIMKNISINTVDGKRPAAEDDFLVCCGEPRLLALSDFNERFIKEDCCFLKVEVRAVGGGRERRTDR